jgi:signal transduction histidine kinase
MTERDLTRKTSSQTFALAGVALWLGVTLALAIWWLIYGLRQIGTLSTLDPELSLRLVSQSRMILYEGLTFIALLLLGGGSLFFLLRREYRRNEQLKVFFATFTHELKTPLASLRLQAEALEEDLQPSENPLVRRLLDAAGRLELQLDNALFLATARNSDQIHLEPVSLSSSLERVGIVFPGFTIQLSSDAKVLADPRALESVLKNLVQNSIIHGGATRVGIEPRKEGDRVAFEIEDNGSGFIGDCEAIGKLFHRHTSRSGSGIGLHLSRFLIERMGGGFEVLPSDEGRPGFRVRIRLMEAVK